MRHHVPLYAYVLTLGLSGVPFTAVPIANACPGGDYLNVNGVCVQDPTPPTTTAGTIPPGVTAICRDGSYSHSTNHSGTCSHHGGVAQWGPFG